MNKANHTPGPWGRESAVSSDFENIRYITGPKCQQVATVHQRPPLCDVKNEGRMSQKEALANAALIAAAPDMLEALNDAAETIKKARRYFPKSIKNGDRFDLENTCATIGKAIQKATL